jgi:uncharacterized protein
MNEDGRFVTTLQPVATPVPLTLAGLLIASVVLSGAELGFVPSAERSTVGWVLLAVPGPLQLLAAFFGFVTRSAAAATGSGVLAAAWVAIALDRIHTPTGGAEPSAAVAMMAFASAAALLVPALAETRLGALLPAGVLALAAARFVATGVAGMTGSVAWTHTSGILGLVVAAAALYGALALELESATQSALLPTFRRGAARRFSHAPLDAQVDRLEREPGVRKIL